MIMLGQVQTLTVCRSTENGVYLESKTDGAPSYSTDTAAIAETRILLPRNQVPEGIKHGDPLRVFVYRDSEDRAIATTTFPPLTLGETAVLTVKETSQIGAFLDWGLAKDLLLPFKEQTAKVKQGEKVLVALYIDKSGRLCATMNVYQNLRADSPYKKDDQVKGRVYTVSEEFGAFVAVDNIYSALIPKKEMYGQVRIGEDVTARVAEVKPDGRLTLSIREKAYLQMEKDAEEILSIIDSYDGVLPFNDKVSPEIIKRETGMSKNEFKRAVGNLLKAGKIEITEKVIRRK